MFKIDEENKVDTHRFTDKEVQTLESHTMIGDASFAVLEQAEKAV